MASDIVRKVVGVILTDDTRNIETERVVLMKESVSYIINKLSRRRGCNGFDKFAKDR